MTDSKGPQIGIYLYGWYGADKWQAHQSGFTPQPGYYDSSSTHLIRWQCQQLARLQVDFVIFEMVPMHDHSFSRICEHLENAIPELDKYGIGYSFFIDFWVFIEADDPLDIYFRILGFLSGKGYLDDVYENPNLGRAIYLFCPYPDLMREIRERAPTGLSVYSALWSPCWERIEPENMAPDVYRLFHRFWDDSVKHRVTLAEELEPMGYFPFWQETGDIISLNGIASVIPGYDDLLLARDPQLASVVPRKNGHTLVEQFRRAVEAGAGSILIYGWNEYFESTTIEPTLEYGDFYVELTRRLIAQARKGGTIHFPEEMKKPEPAKPVYLNPMLEQLAQRYSDKVPRWDQDDYLAIVEVPSGVEIDDSHVFFRDVTVTNIGLKPWRIVSGPNLIRLGGRLCNEKGEIVREGRSELSDRDIDKGGQVTVDLLIEITGLPAGQYHADIDVVWDGKCWFGYPKMDLRLEFYIKKRICDE